MAQRFGHGRTVSGCQTVTWSFYDPASLHQSIYKSGIELAQLFHLVSFNVFTNKSAERFKFENEMRCSWLMAHGSLTFSKLLGFQITAPPRLINIGIDFKWKCCDILPNHTRSGPLLPMQAAYGIRLTQSCILSRFSDVRKSQDRDTPGCLAILPSATSVCGREFHWTSVTNHCGDICHWLWISTRLIQYGLASLSSLVSDCQRLSSLRQVLSLALRHKTGGSAALAYWWWPLPQVCARDSSFDDQESLFIILISDNVWPFLWPHFFSNL